MSEDSSTNTVAGFDHVELLDRLASRLDDCLDVESGLLEKLVASKVITHNEKRRIKRDVSNPVGVLIELLRTKSEETFRTFLEKLKNDDQCHVYNLLMGIDDDDVRPLTESELEMFDVCVLYLRNHLDVKNGLLNNLIACQCINEDHRQRIANIKSDCAGAQELLDILRMRGIRDFRLFAKALAETHQEHLVCALKESGVIVDVEVRAEEADNRVLALVEETLSIVQRDGIIVQNAHNFEAELQRLFSNHLFGVSRGCICISLFCADREAMKDVLRYVYQGSFRADLERWAASQILDTEVRIALEPMTELHRSLLMSSIVRLDVELDSPSRALTLKQCCKAAKSAVVLHCSSPDITFPICNLKTDDSSSLQLFVLCRSREDENTLDVMHSDGSLKATVYQLLTDVSNGEPVGEFRVTINHCLLNSPPLPVEVLELILLKAAARIFLHCPINKSSLRTNESGTYGTMASVSHQWKHRLNEKWITRRFRGVYNEYMRQRIESRRSEVCECLRLSDEKLIKVLQIATKVTQHQMDKIKSVTDDAQQCEEFLAAVYKNRKCRPLLKVLAESDQSNVHSLILSESISKLIVETKESQKHDEMAKNLNSALRYLRHGSQQTTKSVDDDSSSSSRTVVPIADETLACLRLLVNDFKPAELLNVRAATDGSLEILVGCHPAEECQARIFEAYDRKEEERKLKPILNTIFDSIIDKLSESSSKRRVSIARVKLDEDSFKNLTFYRRRRKLHQHSSSSLDDKGALLKREHMLIPSSEEEMTDVTGLAYLDGRLFVAHRSSNTLTVRDARSLGDVMSRVRLPESCHLYDIVACPKSSCLYISDSRPNNGSIWRISADGNSCTVWSRSVCNPRGLSMSATGSLLVVSEMPHSAVYIFRAYDNEKSTSDDHSPSMWIDLLADIDSPRRAVQQSNGNIVVCYGGAGTSTENQGVCVLSESGNHLWSILLNKVMKPYIELDKQERIIIADDRNSRIIRVTVPTAETDETPREETLVPFSAAEEQSRPCRVCLATDDNDAGFSRLFVGLRDGTVLTFRYDDDADESSSAS